MSMDVSKVDTKVRDKCKENKKLNYSTLTLTDDRQQMQFVTKD